MKILANGEFDVREVLDRVFLGKQQIVSHDGISQYHVNSQRVGGGQSSCGLAALNCARIIFCKEDGGLTGEALLHDILTREVAEDIISICQHWTSPSHLDVEDIIAIPLFDASLSLVRSPTFNSHCDLASFKKLLQEMRATTPRCSTAVMITKPPEIVACIKIPTLKGDVFLIFDSHTRPNHPAGAGFILNTSIDKTANYLAHLFEVEKSSSSSGGRNPLQWQLDLMRQFCGHFIVSKGLNSNDAVALARIVMESSVKVLALNIELASAKAENSYISGELKKSQDTLHDMKMRYGPSNRNPKAASHSGKSARAGRTSHSSERMTKSTYPRTGYNRDNVDRHTSSEIGQSFTNDTRKAASKQRQYDEEDRRLAAERRDLLANQPVLFRCTVCLDEHPEDCVAQMQCGHPFCRNCLREYVRSKLSEHLFPILCPLCVVEKSTTEPGVIGDAIIRQIGATEQEYSIFEELQLSAHSILLHCRGCQQSMFIDRKEYQEASVLACPLPGCLHVWCKSCQQTIDMSQPQHSCDGSIELQNLMQKKGWKHCPGCETPIQKESGCHHMTCMSPGCNTHFCYRCGESIIKSAIRGEIKAATSAHYQRCRLFDF